MICIDYCECLIRLNHVMNLLYNSDKVCNLKFSQSIVSLCITQSLAKKQYEFHTLLYE